MNTEDFFITNALQRLGEETGIRGTWKPAINDGLDGEVMLYYNGNNITYYVNARNEVRQYHLGNIMDLATKHNPLLVIAERILPPVKIALIERGIAWFETNGNVYLQNPLFYIHIDKHAPLRVDKPITNRAFTKTGLKAVFHFLNNKAAINDNYRKIAEDTGIALGNVKYIIDGLTEAGYILKVNKKDIQLKNVKPLLERWVAGYRETLKPTLLTGTFRFLDKKAGQNWRNLDLQSIDAVWGGEPAADLITDYLKATKLQLYTALPKNQLIQQWKLIPDKDVELTIYNQFWKRTNTTPALAAPPLLVYTDLLITEDPRCIEAAERIYKNYLKDEFEID
ncbi:type IV toxin-antitoxin system AbiEi family antitoxin [Niabella hirudinis]|uniref:type IV toxin-antitoxin system AbiEi family antitoxin n=1 Tax=Niabella hirudinis TaxID=1285929 RepID=UPI003EB8C575